MESSSQRSKSAFADFDHKCLRILSAAQFSLCVVFYFVTHIRPPLLPNFSGPPRRARKHNLIMGMSRFAGRPEYLDEKWTTWSNSLIFEAKVRMRKFTVGLLLCWPGILCVEQDSRPISLESVKNSVAQLEPYIQSSLASTKVPGVAVAVVYNDQVVFLQGYGVRKVGEPAAIDPDTVFEIASFSKPITSTILASLVGEGKIHWDDRIADLDPGFQVVQCGHHPSDHDPRFPLPPQRARHIVGRYVGGPRLHAPADSLSNAIPLPARPVPQDLRLQQLWL